MLVVLLILGCLAQHGWATKCHQTEVRKFIQDNLGEECQASLILIDFNSPTLRADNKVLDSSCTSSCLGRYANWLKDQCNDTSKATFITTACLHQGDPNSEMKRCRYFFPDFIDISSTHQCARLFSDPETSCSLECKQPLQDLIMNLGCCFQSVYNNEMATISLHDQGFMNGTQLAALSLFQKSNVLENCFDTYMVPLACSIQPFLVDSNGESSAVVKGTRSFNLFLRLSFFVTLVFTFSYSIF